MIVDSVSTANKDRPNRAVTVLSDGRVEVWAEGEPQPAWYQAPVAVPARIVSAEELRDRCTLAEIAGISMLAYSGTGDATAQLLLLKMATNRNGIDLDSDEVISGFDYLVSKGKLTAQRKAEILK